MDISKFEWTTDDIERFKQEVEYFKSFRGKTINQENFFEAYKTCYLLFDKIPLISTEVNVPFVLRGRPNYNGETFDEEWQISYNSRNLDKIKLGRFNRPNSSMFYCTAKNDLEPIHSCLTAALESCKELFLDNNNPNIQYITFGKWTVIKKFSILNLCYNEKYLQANHQHAVAVKKQENQINEIFPKRTADFILNFWRFLSDLAANRFEVETDHFLTTAFLEAFLKYQRVMMKLEGHGVMYPSTLTENTGLNIAIIPTTVDESLSLESAFMVKFIRHSKDSRQYTIEQCTNEAIVEANRFKLVKRSNF